MIIEFFQSYGTELIAAIVLLPVVVFNIALFLERTRLPRWGDARPGPAKRQPPQPHVLASGGGGGLGLRRVTAAPHVHE
ncbi:MAG: hypothetical protein ABI831_06735 [Betaproteobacteria bacterium]